MSSCIFCANCKYYENCVFDPGLYPFFCDRISSLALPDCSNCERGEPECFEYDDGISDLLNDPDCPF